MTVRVRCPKHSPEIDGIVLSSTHVIILKARKGIHTWMERKRSEGRRIGLFIWIGVMLGPRGIIHMLCMQKLYFPQLENIRLKVK